MLILIIFIYMYVLKNEKTTAKKNVITQYIQSLEKNVRDTRLQSRSLYKFYHGPKNLKYIKRSDEISELVYRMRHFKLYDAESFYIVVCLLEYFLKYHFLIMEGKYDANSYFAFLHDLRRNILNELYSMYHNFYTFSSVKDVPNMDDHLYRIIVEIQALTSRYLKIVKNKYNITHNAPYPLDKYDNDVHFEMF